MAMDAKTKRDLDTHLTRDPADDMLPPDGFNVTRVVGRVTFGDGKQSAHEAAFALIAREDAEGTYTFPLADGRECAVTVEYQEVNFHAE